MAPKRGGWPLLGDVRSTVDSPLDCFSISHWRLASCRFPAGAWRAPGSHRQRRPIMLLPAAHPKFPKPASNRAGSIDAGHPPPPRVRALRCPFRF